MREFRALDRHLFNYFNLNELIVANLRKPRQLTTHLHTAKAFTLFSFKSFPKPTFFFHNIHKNSETQEENRLGCLWGSLFSVFKTVKSRQEIFLLLSFRSIGQINITWDSKVLPGCYFNFYILRSCSQ